MLDPTSLSSLTIEAEYVSMAEKDDESQWEEKPLFELRQKFSTPEAARFLEKNILEKQTGRAHPQDPAGLNQEMRLYWVFREGNETTRNKTSVGTRLKATSEVPNNRAAMNALADGLTRLKPLPFILGRVETLKGSNRRLKERVVIIERVAERTKEREKQKESRQVLPVFFCLHHPTYP